jgi:hypothetical protein
MGCARSGVASARAWSHQVKRTASLGSTVGLPVSGAAVQLSRPQRLTTVDDAMSELPATAWGDGVCGWPMRLSNLMMFDDRTQAGRVLGDGLDAYTGRVDVVVLALPRGGVPVAFEVAMSLGAPLEVYPVRKLGVPGHEELAMGAIAGDGTRVVNQAVIE